MAIFLMLTSLTDEGRKTVKENPHRVREVNKEVEKMGVKIISQYALLGPYDFANVIEAPSNEAMSRVAIELGARGTLQTMTMAAMSLSDFEEGLKQ
ncbi:GYD domain-containing protein [Bacteroidota bacterium]